MHVSAEGINAWMRFVVDAERKAWARIEKMREAGELATSKSGTHKNQNLLILSDLIERNSTQRASKWSLLAKLTEHQLNEIENIANQEDRLLTHGELLSLAKAGTPTASKGEKQRSREDIAYITLAAEKYTNDYIEIRENAKIDKTERGAWIEAWVWIDDPLAQSDLEE
jgi:hypothetical protein